MRFAYIDSQGNEVAVPSVDALGLRIELGAIGPDTQLYDAQADQWGPASTHEIFRTISRGLDAEEDFAVPAAAEVPTAPAPPTEPTVDEVSLPPDAGAYPVDRDLAEMLTDFPEGDPPARDHTPVGHAPDSGSLDLDLTLADLPAPGPGGGEATPPDPEGFVAEPGLAEAIEQTSLPSGNELELEVPLSAMDFSGPDTSSVEPMELDPPYSEGPVSEMASDVSAPEGEAQPSRPERAMDFSRGRSPDEDADSLVPSELRAERRRAAASEPRSRPSPPRRNRSRSSSGLLLGFLTVAVVGAGGYFGWSALRGGGGAEEAGLAADARPPVTLPDIGEELIPRMRELGDAAMASTIAELRSTRSEFAVPPEPRGDWLAGVYLASASRFPDVEEYWLKIRAYVAGIRDVDGQVFHDAYGRQMEESGVAPEEAPLLQERADSGFLSTQPARLAAYALMDDLANAALDLHTFLLDNEANITHEPAGGGVSRDPVLEAVPSSAELGDRMWDMVDGITEALDALGTLDRVTTERLSTVLFDRILQIGFH
jgi:hypothetical protein